MDQLFIIENEKILKIIYVSAVNLKLWEQLKKLFSIILILLLMYDTSGIIIFFRIRLITIHEEIEKVINPNLLFDDINLIVVNKFDMKSAVEKVIYKKEKKEFWYNGKLYDVIKIKESKDKLYIYCINDLKEECLLNGVCAFVNHNKGSKLISLTYHSYYFTEEYSAVDPFLEAAEVNLYENNNYKSIPVSIPSPPPRLS